MTNAKEKLVRRLVDDDDIFNEFAVVGLEDALQTIITWVKPMLEVKNLSDDQQEDLNELYYDGTAIIRTLKYFTAEFYTGETALMNKAWDKLREKVF